MTNKDREAMEANYAGNHLSAAEAVYGFVAWLATRNQIIRMGPSYDCAPVAQCVREFCETNSLGDPRDGWEKNLTHPNSDDFADGSPS